jgi:ribose transport system permease protein
MATNWIRSDSLEPTAADLKQASRGARLTRLLPVYGLPILALLLIALFSIILPDTFPTILNLRSIIADKAIIALLSLAAMIPMVSGKIDLTVGYGIVLWHVFGDQPADCVGPALAARSRRRPRSRPLVGLINGILVEVAFIDSFIATLGTGTALYAIALWHTGGRQVLGAPKGFLASNGTMVFGLPITGFYVLAFAFFLWLVLEYLPVGRYLYAIGANPRAAAPNGIPVRRYTIAAFVASGLLTAAAGVLLTSKLRIDQASVALEYLLPALVGAFLGSTTIKPGRVNVLGTMVGVAILAVGIAGIQQFGGSFWVEPMFNSVTLLISIGIAGYAQRRRTAAEAQINRKAAA